MSIKPEFATNREGERVSDAIRDHLRWLIDTRSKDFEMAIATAFFNPGGFSLIADELEAERVSKVRLLLGVAPDLPDSTVRHLPDHGAPESIEKARLRAALSGHTKGMEEDRDLLGFEIEADRAAMRLVNWLRSGTVEVRRFEDGFLHGKAFLVTTDDDGVIAGSSNFTFAGLAKNHELNLGQYQPSVVKEVSGWYEEMWELSKPYDLAALYEARYEPHSPELVYLRMLRERYGAELEAEEQSVGQGMNLTSFQSDGVWRAKRILERRHGVLIADGVGLGKTFVAGELIREATQERRQRVLLVAPAALRDPWEKFLLTRKIGGVEQLSFEELSNDSGLNPDGVSSKLKFEPHEYAMIVIDEAHAYRNPDTQRAQVLRNLLQGSPPKDVVLLSATPVNNSLWDLYFLLSYFIRNDATFASGGIPSVRDYFAKAMALDPEDLSSEHLFDVLDEVVVRRTRHFIKRYYANSEITNYEGEKITIQFPKPEVRNINYDLEALLPGFFERFAHALDCTEQGCDHDPSVSAKPILSLARYAPSQYALSGEIKSYELQLSGLLRSGLLKRFESSSFAFARTCKRMADSHDAFLDLLERGFVAGGTAATDWVNTESEDFEDFLVNQGEDLGSASDYNADELRAAVECDRNLLREFEREADAITAELDPKLAAITDELARIAAEAKKEAIGDENERDLRKVIVFSYFADTVEWVEAFLRQEVERRADLAVYRGRIVTATGSSGNRKEILYGFAPRSMEAPSSQKDKYDLLITTDALAEGVNLQQARHIINYDLPWNPMRLVQRHGRIDRIGSTHPEVYIACTFPDQKLDELLGLEERLLRKIKQAAKSIGVEGPVLPGSEMSETVFTQTREEIEQLRLSDASIFEDGGESHHAYSGEEYRQVLRGALSDHQLERKIKALPWGSGSGLARKGTERGFVFCARIADHPQPHFAYVRYPDGDEPYVNTETLTCLAGAFADEDTERILDDETHALAYEAWASARQKLFEDWDFATDLRRLQPEVPKAMRDAAEVLRDNPPPDLDQQKLNDLIDAIETPYGERIKRSMREAMSSSDDPAKQAVKIVEKARELGLSKSESPKPLPIITAEDVHLVCWQAIVPAD
jgi:hypothetical protein